MISQFIWVLLFILAMLPAYRQRRIELARVKLLQQIAAERKSRVITLIHRQESLSLLGLLSRQYINIEDSEQILRAIRMTPPDTPIDLILHTPGGLVLASEQIAHAIQRHRGKVTVFVPHYAMSGGTLIALAADEIWMDENAVLGPIDPQLGRYPAASILSVLEQKERDKIDDETLILADLARKAIRQTQRLVYGVLRVKLEEETARGLAEALTEGRWTHDYPISCSELRAMGLSVTCGLPATIYALMSLYPQARQGRPTVQYVPIPDADTEQ